MAARSTDLPYDSHVDLVLDCLRRRGALFVADLAQETRLAPGQVRQALWALVRMGLATNDSFDVVRRGEEKIDDAPPVRQSLSRSARSGMWRRGLPSARPRRGLRPEGRWWLISWANSDPERQALLAARLLMQRYGVIARELAIMDERMPPWRVLYEVLSRLELTGEVRRGYFVEGLSGAQFALPDALSRLQETGVPSPAEAPLVLLHSLDPANLYGAGAPFDIPLLDGGARPFLRRLGNWLVLHGGRPVLLIEQHGKRLTALASARPENLARAVALLPETLSRHQLRDIRRKVVVESWNEQPVTATPGKELLEAAGFVRDYQAMAWYGSWQTR